MKSADHLLHDVVPLVEAKVRVRGDAAHRAIAGYSLGGAQTLGIGMAHLDCFGAIGLFSAGPRLEMETVFPEVVADPKGTTRDLRLFFLGCGKADPLMPVSRQMADWLQAKGIAFQFHEYEGAHDWAVWRRCLVDMAPQLFQEAR